MQKFILLFFLSVILPVLLHVQNEAGKRKHHE